MSLAGDIFLLVCAAPAAAGLVWSLWPRRGLPFAPHRLQLPGTARPGPAMFSGVLDAEGEPLVAPLSGRAAAAYEVYVYALTRGRKRDVETLVATVRKGVRCQLRAADGTTMPIDFADGAFELDESSHSDRQVRHATGLSEPVLAQAVHGLGGLDRLALEERLVAAGVNVTIDGEVVRSFADPQRLELRGGPGGRARVFEGDPDLAREAAAHGVRTLRRVLAPICVVWIAGIWAARWVAMLE